MHPFKSSEALLCLSYFPGTAFLCTAHHHICRDPEPQSNITIPAWKLVHQRRIQDKIVYYLSLDGRQASPSLPTPDLIVHLLF